MSKKTVKDLLTDKEKIEYQEIVLRMYREKDFLSGEEIKTLHKDASKILLNAVEREIEKREKAKMQEDK